MSWRQLPTVWLALFCMTAQAATEVIELHYRSAEELLPVVRDILGDQGRVSPYGSQLVVNASPAKIGEVRVLLQQLDTQPKRLLISVQSGETRFNQQHGYDVNARIGNSNASVQIGEGADNSTRIIRRSSDARSGEVQQVQATEGYPALISAGQSIPLTTAQTDAYGRLYPQTQYQDLNRGFYVTATVHGDNVALMISNQRDRLSQQQYGVIERQSAETRLAGKLGQWIELGAIKQELATDERSVLRSHRTQGREDSQIRVKVDVVQ